MIRESFRRAFMESKRGQQALRLNFLLRRTKEENVWEVLAGPGKKAKKPGARFIFGNGLLKAEVLEVVEGRKSCYSV